MEPINKSVELAPIEILPRSSGLVAQMQYAYPKFPLRTTFYYLRNMNGHKITNQQGLHFITCTVVGWVDVFTRKKYKDIIIESLRFCMENKGLIVYAYIIMSNHVHLVIGAKEELKLSDIIRDFKTHTSKKILGDIISEPGESRSEWMLRLFKYYSKFNSKNRKYQFWQRDNKPIELNSPKWISRRVNYIHNNPVEAGIVQKPEHYIYSSASNYLQDEGILNVDIIDIGVDIGYLNI